MMEIPKSELVWVLVVTFAIGVNWGTWLHNTLWFNGLMTLVVLVGLPVMIYRSFRDRKRVGR